MAAPLGPLSDPGAEISLLEINQELQSQLEKSQQDFRDLKEKFLISEATAYSLANQLQKYKCEESTDIIESVLGEKVRFEKGKRADTVAEKLRLYHILIKDQAKELTRLCQKLREGKDVSQLLNKHLEDLLTHDDPEHPQGQGFQEQLAEGRRLAKCLVRKLSAENYEDEEDEEEQETLTPSMEQQEVEKKEVLQDTVDECVLTPSTLQEGCESDQSYSDGEFPLDEQEFGSALDLACACSHTQGDETPCGPPESQDDLGEGNGQHPTCLSTEPQEVEKKEFLQDTVDECLLTPSTLQEGCDSDQSCHDGKFLFDEQEFGFEDYSDLMDIGVGICEGESAYCNSFSSLFAENRIDQEGLKGQESAAPRSAAIFLPEELEVCSSLEVTSEYSIVQVIKLHLDTHKDLLFFVPQTSASISSDKVMREGCSTFLECRFPRELPVAEENDVPQDSLDECYLTSSVGHDLPDTWRPYTSASSIIDKLETFLGLDVDVVPEASRGTLCNSLLQWYLKHRGRTSSPVLFVSGTHRGNWTFQRAEVQTSGAQTQPSTQVANILTPQLDQQLDCGDNRARLSLSCTLGSLDAKMGSGNQWPLFQAGFGSFHLHEDPPKLDGDATEGSRDSQCGCHVCGPMKALGAMKQKIIKRKLQFGKWRLASTFRGLQA
ncbi:NBPF family member NBPF6-like [Halichoerus grypus]